MKGLIVLGWSFGVGLFLLQRILVGLHLELVSGCCYCCYDSLIVHYCFENCYERLGFDNYNMDKCCSMAHEH